MTYPFIICYMWWQKLVKSLYLSYQSILYGKESKYKSEEMILSSVPWTFMDSPTENLVNKEAPGQDCQFFGAQLMKPAGKYWNVIK